MSTTNAVLIVTHDLGRDATVVERQTFLSFLRLFRKVIKEFGHLLYLDTEGGLVRFTKIGERVVRYCPLTLTSHYLNETNCSSLSYKPAAMSLGMRADLVRLIVGASDNVPQSKRHHEILLRLSRRYVSTVPGR